LLPLTASETNPGQAGSAGDRVGTALPLLQTAFAEANGEVSPDGRWLAYQSTDSGRWEIYVRPFPEVRAGRTQVSTGGGRTPLWDRAGRKLYFRSATGAVMSVDIVPGAAWHNEPPMEAVPARYFDSIGNNGRTFDVSPDGKRFLMIKQPGGASAVQHIVIVTNWFEELKRLVPGK
jgi:eukaryotic-like serine/threonine-protein kinase